MTVYLASLFKKISKFKVKAYVYINILDHMLIIGLSCAQCVYRSKILLKLVA